MRRTLVFTGQGWEPSSPERDVTASLRWIDIEAPDEEDFLLLEQGFKFHPLAVEDCRHLDQRSKLEEYAGHLFVVLHALLPRDGDPTDLRLQELHVFLAGGAMVTVHAEPMDAVGEVWSHLGRAGALVPRTPVGVLHSLADALVDSLFPPVEALNALIDDVAERVIDEPDAGLLARTMAIKRAVLDVRRLLGPAREVLAALARAEFPGVTGQDALYFRDVLDHLQMLQQQIDTCRELVADTRDVYLNAQGNRVNQIVKRLTVMATLGLPLTFFTGFFGMNFTHLPFGSVAVMAAALAGMVAVPAGMLAFFRWKDWL